MISVFYWLSSRPLLMPYGACAILGFFLDLWLDVPMGMNMVLLLLTRLFVVNTPLAHRNLDCRLKPPDQILAVKLDIVEHFFNCLAFDDQP